MFECSHCVSRSLRALISETTYTHHALRRPLALTPIKQIVQRRSATAAVASRNGIGRNGDILPASGAHKTDMPSDGTSKRLSIKNERALRTEIQYLKDPVKFANHVHYILRCNKPEKALDLCRLGSKTMNCVVAWNHSIDWLMKKEKVDQAIKVYNEMKKRAQHPDSYTYVLLLRGFPQYRTHHAPEVKKNMMAKALSIYDSMSNPTSKVKPSIIHTNAILRVCSLARDMDALWGIVSQLPESGPGSADCVTYTILLSAIRHSAYSDEGGLSLQQVAQIRQRAVDEGRRIWQDIMIRWRGGDVLVDEGLVCEMGRLLLVSKRMEDWDDVLNLVHQTTNIARLLAPLGSPERHTEHIPKAQEDEKVEAMTTAEENEGWSPTPANNAFKPIDPHIHDHKHSRIPRSLTWVQPGNAMLSLLVEACTNMRASKAMLAYWDLFVSKCGVGPDRVNYHSLLQFLRVNRNSARAAAIIEDMHTRDVELRNQTFRIAMSVCARNPKNPNVLVHAGSIVGRMLKNQNEPDIATLESYVDLATRIKDGGQILTILDKIQPIADSLRSRVEQSEATTFLQTVIGAIDILSQDNSVSSLDVERWRVKRSELDSAIGQATNSITHQRQYKARKESLRKSLNLRPGIKDQARHLTAFNHEGPTQQRRMLLRRTGSSSFNLSSAIRRDVVPGKYGAVMRS